MNKPLDPDSLYPVILKHYATELVPILEFTFAQSLNTNDIPAVWLVANNTPVHKKHD